MVIRAVDQRAQGECAQLVIPELVTRTGTDGALAGKVFDLVTLVHQATLPEPFVRQETVEGVLSPPIVRGGHVILILAVVLAFCDVPPAAMTRSGLEVDVVIIGIFLGTLVIEGRIDIAFPHQILDHRLGLEDLLDTRQLYRLGPITVFQGHLAVIRRVQRLGLLAGVGVLLDQQLLITFQGLDLFPVDRHRAGIFGLDQQLAAIEQDDLAAQLVTVLQPDGIREQGSGGSDDSEA
ncbi:hypothetical protein D3C76_958000 [compost metagenome]